MKAVKLAALILFVSSTHAIAHAQSNQEGSLELSGMIPVVTTITVVPTDSATNLDLVDGATDLKVATVSERNNTFEGYYVTLKSKNDGKLDREGSREARHFNKIRYSAKYDGNPVRLERNEHTIYRSRHHNWTAQARDVDFDISYDAQDPTQKLAGKYSDCLTFTITAR